MGWQLDLIVQHKFTFSTTFLEMQEGSHYIVQVILELEISWLQT